MKKTILSLMLVSSSIFAMEGKTMTVYKSPYCGCCEKWIDIMSPLHNHLILIISIFRL